MHIMKRLLAVWLLIVVGLTGGCRQPEGEGAAEAREEVRIVSQVLSTDDPRRFEVRWFPSGCERFERVDVEESTDEVGLTVWVWVDSGDCSASTSEEATSIELAQPLGERVFVDSNMGTTVKLNAEPGPPEDLDP